MSHSTKTPTHLFFTTIIALGLCTQASAATVFQYEGNVDPLTLSNWTKSPGDNGAVGAGTEIINSVSYDYWQVEDNTSSQGNFYAYDVASNTVDFTNDWYLESSLRVINSPTVPGTTNVPAQAVVVADGLNYWSFYVGNDVIGPVDGAGSSVSFSMSQTLPADYWNDYHTFAIQFSQNAIGSADDTADFFIDGVLIWNDIGRDAMYSSGNSLIGFGGVSTLGTGEANYDYIRFDDGSVGVVPIPAAIWLFGSGLIGLVGFARSKKA